MSLQPRFERRPDVRNSARRPYVHDGPLHVRCPSWVNQVGLIGRAMCPVIPRLGQSACPSEHLRGARTDRRAEADSAGRGARGRRRAKFIAGGLSLSSASGSAGAPAPMIVGIRNRSYFLE